MFSVSLLKQFTRLSICSASKLQANIRSVSTTNALQFNLTQPLCGEPLKKKKKMDPAVVKAREDRRRRKIEKQIRRLEKNARQLKPIDEVEVSLTLIDEIPKRRRPQVKLTVQETEARAHRQKEWASYKREEYMANVAQIDRIMAAQKRALDQLYEVSEELYNEAIQPDPQLIPYSIEGPVKTPPPPGHSYQSPDGEYIDVSKKWDN